MKRLIAFTGFIGLALAAHGSETPRGTLLELHSCELYAGGCVVSAEVPQAGKYMVRVWDFSSGNFQGTDLKGLKLAVLQTSIDNLALTDAHSGQAMVYLPETATEAQRTALVAWLKDQKDFHPAKLQTRIVPLQFTRNGEECSFKGGDFISVKSAAMACETQCGEALWFEPRTQTSVFTVAENRASRVTEPLLELNWTDSEKRSIFLARFGEPASRQNVFVTMTEFCGAKL